MNRTIYSAASEQAAVGGVDNGVCIELGDIAENDFDFHGVSLWFSTMMVAAARAAVVPFLDMWTGIRRRAG
jgi:hypothetical protein